MINLLKYELINLHIRAQWIIDLQFSKCDYFQALLICDWLYVKRIRDGYQFYS